MDHNNNDMIDKAAGLWGKVRNDFLMKINLICGIGVSLLYVNNESEIYRKFLAFCEKKLVRFPGAYPAEVYTFIVLIRFPDLVEATQQYLGLRGRKVREDILLTKARRVVPKVLNYFEALPELQDHLINIFENEDEDDHGGGS